MTVGRLERPDMAFSDTGGPARGCRVDLVAYSDTSARPRHGHRLCSMHVAVGREIDAHRGNGHGGTSCAL